MGRLGVICAKTLADLEPEMLEYIVSALVVAPEGEGEREGTDTDTAPVEVGLDCEDFLEFLVPILVDARDCDEAAAEACARELWARLGDGSSQDGGGTAADDSLEAAREEELQDTLRREGEEGRRRKVAERLRLGSNDDGREAPEPEPTPEAHRAAPDPEPEPARAKRKGKGKGKQRRRGSRAAGVCGAGEEGVGSSSSRWVSGADDERVEPLTVEAAAGQAEAEFEEAATPVREWGAEALAHFIRGLTELGGRAIKPKHKPLLEGVAKAVSQTDLTADVLLISGAEVLRERCAVGMRKHGHQLQSMCARIVEALGEELARDGQREAMAAGEGYWESIVEGSEEEQVMAQALADTEVGRQLQQMLALQPEEAVRYCVKHCDVTVTSVQDHVSWLSDDAQDLYKVVSVCEPGMADVVSRNFLFYKADCGQGATDDAGGQGVGECVSRGGLGVWRLLVSVDFEQHGSAPPGHWHLNVTPNGDLMPHWGADKDHAVFHGDVRRCPLWWILIPCGYAYKHRPERTFANTSAAAQGGSRKPARRRR